MNNSGSKQLLREEFLQRRSALDTEYRAQADAAICGFLEKLPECGNSSSIAAYMTDGTEPDLRNFINSSLKNGKRVFLPKYSPKSFAGYEMVEIFNLNEDVVPGKYGLLEPRAGNSASVEQLGGFVWTVPGVAFDLSGYRLGRGKGVYDRLLDQVSGQIIGIFYECQKVAAVPVHNHDHKLGMVVTECGIISFKNSK